MMEELRGVEEIWRGWAVSGNRRVSGGRGRGLTTQVFDEIVSWSERIPQLSQIITGIQDHRNHKNTRTHTRNQHQSPCYDINQNKNVLNH